ASRRCEFDVERRTVVPRTRVIVLLAVVASISATSSNARAQDLFGRFGAYDATGSEVVRSHPIRPTQPRGFSGGHGAAVEPTIELRRNFIYVEDTAGTLHVPYMQAQDLFDS